MALKPFHSSSLMETTLLPSGAPSQVTLINEAGDKNDVPTADDEQKNKPQTLKGQFFAV
jgi:hypothetical protein